MKSNLKFSIILFVIVLIAVALMQAGQKQPINWLKTYNTEDKIPYGTYVLKHELPHFFKSPKKITTNKNSLYQYLEQRDSSKDNQQALFFIGYAKRIGKVGKEKLRSFVKKGGTAFIATKNINNFFDSLGLATEVLNTYQSGLAINEQLDFYISLTRYDKKIHLDKLEFNRIFTQLPDSNITILGNITLKNTTAPNFIKLKFGKGTFFIHTTPELFTNYYLLNDTTLPIVINTLQYISAKDILWYDNGYNINDERTPLRFILSQPTLSWAWYLLFFTLLLYLIFQSRREQRSIPIVLPERNRSVDFAKTIGSLYYENGNPGNMIQKKIDYFLFALRKEFNLDTDNLQDEKFLQIIHQRTGIPLEEIKNFFLNIQVAQQNENGTINDLKTLNKRIEAFKVEAKIKG